MLCINIRGRGETFITCIIVVIGISGDLRSDEIAKDLVGVAMGLLDFDAPNLTDCVEEVR